MDDYRCYIESFVHIKDEDIKKKVKQELSSGKLWPKPLIQFNPAFAIYGNIEKLIEEKGLHPKLKDIFSGFQLYEHQAQAIELGSQEKDFIVTSGTGSGKSLTYISTIFNHLLVNKDSKGIKAIIVYPMNALINSQTEEIKKYEENYVKKGKSFPIRYAQYTGQEDQKTREDIKENPPDILLTN